VNPPRVAVIIPTFNRWPHVRQAVDSVLTQTYPNAECVVVDDASTDGTSHFLCGEYRDRVRFLTKAVNGEKSAARNDGIRATKAAFVCFLDSDDLLTPDSVEARIELYLRDPTFDGVVYGPVVSEQNEVPKACPEGDVLAAYVRHRFVRNPGFLISLQNMLTHGMYREDLTHREDVELLIRLAATFPFKCCKVPVARIRRLDRSARFDYAKQVRQGDRVVRYLRNDPFVVERLGKRFADVEFHEAKELAGADYRLGDLPAFRRGYLQLWKRWPSRAALEGRFLRRFLGSFL